jgi:thiol-disulfide isomerase/thioredoxin
MKRTILLCLALLCALSLCACRPAVESGEELTTDAAVWTGSAPNFAVLDKEGNAVQLSDFAGKPVVLNFWATWCGYCKVEMPDFDQAYKEYPDVVFMMIDATDGMYETREKADAYVKEQGFSFPVYYDVSSLAQNAYVISGYPTTVFINAQGDVVAKEVGMISYETLIAGIKLITE